MLKRDPNGKFVYREVGFLKTRLVWRFETGNMFMMRWMEKDEYRKLLAQQEREPVPLVKDGKKKWRMFKGEFYWEDEDLTEEEVLVLILDRFAQKDRKIKRAMARVAMNDVDQNKREYIADDVKLLVWQRDKGRCVQCDSQENLEYDHIIPVAKGGSNTARNIQILCETCNRSKGADLF